MRSPQPAPRSVAGANPICVPCWKHARAHTVRTIHSRFMHPGRAHLLSLAVLLATTVCAQTVTADLPPPTAPSIEATPLPENRGAAALYESLKRLDTTASLMMIVAHPDDEDGGMLTYESRALGVRTALFTLTRGEGGQNAMSAADYDALGLIRTNELLRADEYYGVGQQYWGSVADYGFSKTMEEALSQWGHDRVLYDAVRAIRMYRPMVVCSVFVGGVSATISYHGRSPCCAGLDQVVFTVPANAPTGCYVPVVVRMSGTVVSNAVTMAIASATGASSCSRPMNSRLKQRRIPRFTSLGAKPASAFALLTPAVKVCMRLSACRWWMRRSLRSRKNSLVSPRSSFIWNRK